MYLFIIFVCILGYPEECPRSECVFGARDVHIAIAISKYYGINPHLLKYSFKLKNICPVPAVASYFFSAIPWKRVFLLLPNTQKVILGWLLNSLPGRTGKSI